MQPLPQPAPTALLWGLLLLTFFLHLVAMNLSLGGSVVALVTRWRAGRSGNPHAHAAVAWFARALPTLVAATVTFGVAPLLFLQVLYGDAFFASAIIMAWPWLSVVALVMAAYYGAYRIAFRTRGSSLGAGGLAAAVTLLFVVVAFIYTNNMTLMLGVDRFAALTANGTPGWHWNTADATLVPRYLHVLIGATAVAGVGLALLGLTKRHAEPEFGRWAMRAGSGWAAGATLLNLVVGFWWMLALPREVLLRFMGRDPFAAVVLMVGVVLGMVVLATASLASRANDPAPMVKGTIGTLLATLVAMVLTRDQVRESTFVLAGVEPARWVETQWVPLAIFVVLLVAAAATVAWMVMLLVRAPRASTSAPHAEERTGELVGR